MTTPSDRAGPEPTRARIPLICPRCGREQQVVPGGPERAIRVVHVGTGREACEPEDLARAPDDDS
ncbi:hypothetical protein [Streptomyces sp. NRRL S-350]|uniref:hypothetical protein n=1 Tax=Streptomyces sp. NRRL S-350 TaxID=1463902 RepID=UPI0004C19AF9|nr:hypothetical protein [Streptomyces sp. NRRL S-350]